VFELSSFDALWSSLKEARFSQVLTYNDPSQRFTAAVRGHFNSLPQSSRYGVYVVTAASSGQVLYVGKAGTVASDGKFKAQDIPGRLTAERANKTSSDRWFAEVCSQEGALKIEYVVLPNIQLAPATAEALLLQAFLIEHHCLPKYNKGF